MHQSDKRSKGVLAVSTAPSALGGLPPHALRWCCDPSALGFSSTADVTPVTSVVGQDTAVEALRYGLETNAPGQNIFVRGLTGTGRLTLVRRLLEEIRLVCPETKDCCYVHNFSQPDCPRLLTFRAGRGQEFRRRMDKLADFVRNDLRTALSSEGIRNRRSTLEQTTQKRLEEIVAPFEQALRSAGLTLASVEASPVMQTAIFPLINGKAVAPEEYDQLHARGEIKDDAYKAVRKNYIRFEKQLSEINEKTNEIRRKHAETVGAIFEKAARSILDNLVCDIQAAFPEPGVKAFLAEVVDDVATNRLHSLNDQTDFTRLYHVNVVLEHKGAGACPIIVENVPTVRNLLGNIDFEVDPAHEVRPGHLGIRAGSLLRADGGYLILEDREVLHEPGAWKVLKRVLRTGRLEIAPPETPFPPWGRSLKPEPIDINVKVVLLGDPRMYDLLDKQDADFSQLFKVLADFDSVIPRNEAGINLYAGVLARIAREEQLPHFDRTAVSSLAEHGARIASSSGKLTSRFGRLADIAREAAFIAGKQRQKHVTGEHVREAIQRGKSRADLPLRRFLELLAEGTIRIETKGSVVGQINGLAVLQAGPMTYGFPTRITATIGPGTTGVINIERESALSGAIHTKGFYILGGLLRFLLRTDHPLSFDASVAFEQSYGAIDGDSASGAEICCLLSALTDIPLRQDLAMTGAIDQMGHILAVGAVDEKIEGFFDACGDRDMLRTQGVIVPKANAGDLMLREDVVQACTEGKFHVYAVETVHEALALLTGMPAGTRDARGLYAEDTVLGIAIRRAQEYWLKASQAPAPRRRAAGQETET